MGVDVAAADASAPAADDDGLASPEEKRSARQERAVAAASVAEAGAKGDSVGVPSSGQPKLSATPLRGESKAMSGRISGTRAVSGAADIEAAPAGEAKFVGSADEDRGDASEAKGAMRPAPAHAPQDSAATTTSFVSARSWEGGTGESGDGPTAAGGSA
jgi:hypothetical protein